MEMGEGKGTHILHLEPLTVIFPQSRNCAFLHAWTMRRPRVEISEGGEGMARVSVSAEDRRRKRVVRRFMFLVVFFCVVRL